jgi:phosphoglycerate dehydrogenase-like enzyme
MIDALVSSTAWKEFSDLLTAGTSGVSWWLMDPDGTVHPAPGTAAPAVATAPAPEVAWISNDVFRDSTLQPMTDVLLSSPIPSWVQSGAAGTDTPLLEGLIGQGTRLTTSHVTAIPIAEYVLLSVLNLYMEPERWAASARCHQWAHRNFREVSGTTWLIVGLGGIGTEVAVRATAFGARVIGVRRSPAGDEPVDEVITPDRLAGAVPDADVIVLCAPGSADTRHLFGESMLAVVRPGAILVNVARGSLVDEDALIRSLDSGRLGHAVLDVFATEPLPADSPLWDHPGVTVTPHSSGGGLGRYRRSAEVFAANLARYLRGDPLLHEVGR